MNFRNYLNEEKEETFKKILNFFEKNPEPSDKQIHKLSDDLKTNTHSFEASIYELLGSFWGYGKSIEEKFNKEDADKKELESGTKIEMEHTNNKLIAEKIALDHLAEIPDYYSRLIKMEKEALGNKE